MQRRPPPSAFTVFPQQTLPAALSLLLGVNYSLSSFTPCIKCNLFRNLAVAGLAALLCAPQPWEASLYCRHAPPRARPSLGRRGHPRSCSALPPYLARAPRCGPGRVLKSPLLSFGRRSPEGGGSSVRWLLCVLARRSVSPCCALSPDWSGR